MVQQTIQFETVSPSEIGSGTITAFLYSGDTLAATLANIQENSTLKGRHTGTVDDKAAADYRLVVKFDGYTISEPDETVTLLLAVGTYVSKRLAVLDSDITNQLDDIEADAAAAAGYGASLVSRITSEVAQMFLDMIAMITGTGTAAAKFDADALSLAPAGGLTEPQDELLTTIGQRTAQITGSRLSVTGPVTPGGQISLVVGSDYVDDIDSSLIRTVTDAGETLHDALTAGELTDLVFSAAPKSNASTANKISGTVAAVSHAGGVTSITIEIARADIPNGPYDEDWKYQIWRTTDDHVSPPLLEGQLLLHWRA